MPLKTIFFWPNKTIFSIVGEIYPGSKWQTFRMPPTAAKFLLWKKSGSIYSNWRVWVDAELKIWIYPYPFQLPEYQCNGRGGRFDKPTASARAHFSLWLRQPQCPYQLTCMGWCCFEICFYQFSIFCLKNCVHGSTLTNIMYGMMHNSFVIFWHIFE